MKKLILRTEKTLSSFDIPVEFVDKYLAEAPELSLKLYLYLLRSSLDPSVLLSVHEMADRFDVTPNKITLALHYWVEKGLLSLGYSDGELSDIMLLSVGKERRNESAEKAAGKEDVPVPVRDSVPETPVFDIGALFEDGTLYLNGALYGNKILNNANTVALRLPKLPHGYRYSDFGISGTDLFASWEESDFYKTGRSGFIQVDLGKILYE